MSAKEIDVIVIISPKPGKKERVEELLTKIADEVQRNELGTLAFQLHFQEETGEFIFVEKYKDVAAHDYHTRQSFLHNTIKTVEDEELLSKPIDIRTLKPAGGFAGRIGVGGPTWEKFDY